MGAPVIHFEIGCRDKKKTADFYAKLFDWNMQDYGGTPMIDTASDGQGIGGHINALGHEPHNYVTIYAQVDDIDATLKRAEKLGGKTIVPRTDVPQMGHFAWFADPEGNTVGLWTPMNA